jgi:hypothetical protein
VSLDDGGARRVEARLKGLERIDAADVGRLLDDWEDIIVEDNRRGVLSGLDKDGEPLTEVTYRGQGAITPRKARSGDFFGSSRKQDRLRTVRSLSRKGVRLVGRSPKGAERSMGDRVRFKGLSDYTFTTRAGVKMILANNNLSTAAYKRLDGPPLAPRREASRVIANLVTGQGRDGDDFFAAGGWQDVVSPKGVPFLGAHFKGENGLPKRDLRGVRPWGMAKARAAVRTWARWLLGGKV